MTSYRPCRRTTRSLDRWSGVFPPGQHKVKIELFDANHNVIAGQSKTITFIIPERASHHSHWRSRAL